MVHDVGLTAKTNVFFYPNGRACKNQQLFETKLGEQAKVNLKKTCYKVWSAFPSKLLINSGPFRKLTRIQS
jgi:hypothetical protein